MECVKIRIYRDNDVDLEILKNKKISVLGYGAQGKAQAQCFRDSGLEITVGVRKDGPSWIAAKEDGFKVATLEDAVKDADIVLMLLPDEAQPEIYEESVAPYLKSGAALEFAHGFSITYDLIHPPADVDVIMMAPKGPGTMIRKVYVDGFGVPAMVCIHQDATGNAMNLALALAKGIGATRAGVFEATFQNETYTDLYGEQSVLCGGLNAMILAAFETMVERGYPPEMAYFEIFHETKLITDMINTGGFETMWHVVSNTAEFGGLTRRNRVINEESRAGMASILDDIESGKFKDEWRAEWKNGLKNMHAMEKKEAEHQIESVGREIRELFKIR